MVGETATTQATCPWGVLLLGPLRAVASLRRVGLPNGSGAPPLFTSFLDDVFSKTQGTKREDRSYCAPALSSFPSPIAGCNEVGPVGLLFGMHT